MLTEWETMHGGDQIVVHNYIPTYVCGLCGAEMRYKSHCLECPSCHFQYADNHNLAHD